MEMKMNKNRNTYDDNSQMSFLGLIWCLLVGLFFTFLPFREWLVEQFYRIFVAKEVAGDDQQS
jgi:hypothetical protein